MMSPAAGAPSFPALKIGSFDELTKQEKEILNRIARYPNGGHLFMIHPFLLLADVGVELSDTAKQEIVKLQPEISGLSRLPYDALKGSTGKQNVHFNIKGLFRRAGK